MKPEEIGKRITQAREMAGLFKNELANKIHVSPSTISRYENGEFNKISIPVLHSIANVTGVNPLWLSGESDSIDLPSSTSTDKNTLSDREQSHIQVYRDLSDGGKDKVDHYTDTVKSMERQESDSDIVDRFRKRFVARNGNKNLSPDQMQAIMDILDEEDDD